MLHAHHPHHAPPGALMPPHMSMCHLDFNKMQASLPGQMYPANAFEGILELRKEKSRDAARSRRGKENYEFYELAKLLPLPGAITSQLDKASIIRLTISYLKLKDFSCHGDPPWQRDSSPHKCMKGAASRRRGATSVTLDMYEAHQGTHILQSLDGFVFALSNDGRFLYVSETVSIYLGLSQVEMTGSSIFDYTHYDDHKELADQLGLNTSPSHRYASPPSTAEDKDDSDSPPPNTRSMTPTLSERTSVMNPNPSKGYERCFCIRMKSTLTKRGVHAKCSGYRVVQILARMKAQYSFSLTRKHPPQLLGLVAMAIALPPPTITELLIDNDMFVTRLGPDLKITYIEPRIGDMMDLTSEDLTGRNLYDYCHAEDLPKLRKAHIDLLDKGQVLTDYYRLMNKHGGYVWIQTCATIICNSKTSPDEQNIIAINYVLSGIEFGGCVMNMEQYKIVSPNCDADVSDQPKCDNSEKGRKDTRNSMNRDRSHDHYDAPQPPSKKRRQTANTESVANGEMASRSSIEDTEPQFVHSEMGEGSLCGLYSSEEGRYDKNCRIDNKNSRRKMDKPRKRKKENEDGDGDSLEETRTSEQSSAPVGVLNGDITTENTSIPYQGACARASSPRNASLLTSSSPDMTSKICSPSPEDLSVRPLNSQSPVTAQTPPARSMTPSGRTNAIVSAGPDQNWVESTEVPTDIGTDPVGSGGNSVRELEEAMNKHLPSVQSSDVDAYRAGLNSEYTSSVMDYQKHKATIQWIGSHNPSVTDTLPATNLLRNLYASRESVIRTNIYNPRPQYYGDMQSTLLTPPGASEVYKESFSMPQLSQPKTPPTSTYSLMNGGYSTSPISVAMATNMSSDAYTMTPPSSVSPQEKYGSSAYATDQMHGDVTSSHIRQYDTSNMLIKPQAYPLPAHSNSHLYDRTTSQYPAGGYYGTTPSAGFSYSHVPSPNPAHYRDASKTANAW